VSKDIEDFYRKALLNYKDKSRSINISSGDANGEIEVLTQLFSLKNESILIFNKCALMNEEIMTNKTYNDLYSKNLKDLEREIKVEEEKILSRKKEDEKK
jgi:hypothetical protein